MGNGYIKRFHVDFNGRPLCGECPPVMGLPKAAFLAHPIEHRCKKCQRTLGRSAAPTTSEPR
jgi:hypothetical protein